MELNRIQNILKRVKETSTMTEQFDYESLYKTRIDWDNPAQVAGYNEEDMKAYVADKKLDDLFIVNLWNRVDISEIYKLIDEYHEQHVKSIDPVLFNAWKTDRS